MVCMLNKIGQSTIDELKTIVGANGWKNPGDHPSYFEDPRDRFSGRAAIILMPDTTEQVSKIVKYCSNKKLGIIPYGGGTGAVAGQLSIESNDRVLLSLEKMNNIRKISLEDDAMVVEAGCILADIQTQAADHNRLFPLSLASEGSCRIGGNLSTNAGGIQVLRYGNTRDLCLGIEAVLPDGSVLDDLKPLRKDNTGFDLRHLLIGAEGTLGVITAATLKLLPRQPETATAMCVINTPSTAVTLLQTLKTEMGETVSACELMCEFGIHLMSKHFPEQRYPFSQSYGWFALVEVAGPHGTREMFESKLGLMFEREIVLDAVIAESGQQRQTIWNLREMTPEANRLEGAICNSDTSVPISKIDDFIRITDEALEDLHPGLRVNCYGHIGDGNIHYNVFPPEGISKPEFLHQFPDMRETTRMTINKTTHACGGSISAEHGIGRLKSDDLSEYGDPAKLAAMQSIKKALDPAGIMNPGAIFRA